jgi:hypothetical protein
MEFAKEYNEVTIIVVTSPCPTCPSTELIDTCLLSIYEKIKDLKSSETIIVMDGYKIYHENKLKQGKITSEYKDQYDLYYEALRTKYTGPQFRIERLKQHMGFAFAVKHALDLCTTTFALICQHDRVFCCNFLRLNHLLRLMETHTYIRYIGFPTAKSVTHSEAVGSRFHMKFLNSPPNKIDMGNDMALHPLVFWYDSQHLCHVERYKQIFLPYTHMSQEMRDTIGFDSIKETMILRRGNFIEDSFGQGQKRALVGMAERGVDQCVIEKIFRWFGSYLCCIKGIGEQHDDKCTQRNNTVIMVAHMKGRAVINKSFLQLKIAGYQLLWPNDKDNTSKNSSSGCNSNSGSNSGGSSSSSSGSSSGSSSSSSSGGDSGGSSSSSNNDSSSSSSNSSSDGGSGSSSFGNNIGSSGISGGCSGGCHGNASSEKDGTDDCRELAIATSNTTAPCCTASH